ncbi:MAG TPA: hypothetical protein DCX46_12570 [Bacteroidetes bacterium]|nr:hypothetical protein [Bacteroidota bacterium]
MEITRTSPALLVKRNIDMNTFRISSQFILGLIIIAVGVVITLDNLDILYAADYLRYWPALLVVYGLVRLAEPRHEKFWAGLFLIVGTLMLLDVVDLIEFRLRDWWPVVLIFIGGSILWGSHRRLSGRSAILNGNKGEDADADIRLTAVLGGITRSNSSKDFHGGEITAIMGGCELDLRNAEIQKEAVLDVTAFWGGISLRVPPTWTVSLEGVPFMGGFSDETSGRDRDPAKRLVIRGNAIMGGVEVKN